jgi:hypothetical protein
MFLKLISAPPSIFKVALQAGARPRLRRAVAYLSAILVAPPITLCPSDSAPHNTLLRQSALTQQYQLALPIRNAS